MKFVFSPDVILWLKAPRNEQTKYKDNVEDDSNPVTMLRTIGE